MVYAGAELAHQNINVLGRGPSQPFRFHKVGSLKGFYCGPAVTLAASSTVGMAADVRCGRDVSKR